MATKPERARAPIAQVAHPSTFPAAHLAESVRRTLMPRKCPPLASAVTGLPRRLREAQVRVACAIQGTRATESLRATPARRIVSALAKKITTETRKAAGATHVSGIQCLKREARLFPNAIAYLGITQMVQRFVLHALQTQGRRREAPTSHSVFVIWEHIQFHHPTAIPRNVWPVR